MSVPEDVSSSAPVEPAQDRDGDEVALPGLAAQVERVAAPLREQVLDLLRREIVELRLRPGQRLVERELVEQIGVSRTTVREVLRELAAEGLVQTIPQRGAIVAAPTAREAAEVYEVRALLEGLAAREFVKNASEADLAALDDALAEIEVCGEASDAVALLLAKNRFYGVLFYGARNVTVREILEGLQARVALLRATSLAAPDRPRQSVIEIKAIVDAIKARDGDRAAEAAAFHVRQAAETLFVQLEARNRGDLDG